MISLQDAVEDLYRIAVVEKKRQSPNRLALLADMCVEQLDERGIVGAQRELLVPGIGRSKTWDVGWPSKGKVRLGISLKSLLRNIPGTVPNRVDDLAGEMANVQLLSPEIVTGYIVVFDTGASGPPKGRDSVGRLLSICRGTDCQVGTLPRGRPGWSKLRPLWRSTLLTVQTLWTIQTCRPSSTGSPTAYERETQTPSDKKQRTTHEQVRILGDA